MKKKIIAFAAALSVFASSGLSVSAEEGKALLVLGDSIATGYGLEGYEAGDNSSAKDSFANKLSENFDSYENLAVDGMTTEGLLEIVTDENNKTAVENADTVVISIGGNDFLVPLVTAMQMSIMSDPEVMTAIQDGTFTVETLQDKITPETVKKAFDSALSVMDVNASFENLNKIIESINSANDDCDIYVLTVENPFAGFEDMAGTEEAEGLEEYADLASSMESLKELSGKYNDAVMNLPGTYDNVYTIDVYSAFEGKETEYTNISDMDVHPNKAGHEVIYNLLAEKMAANEVSDAPSEETSAEETSAAETAAPVEEKTAPKETAPASDNASSSADTGNMGAVTLSVIAGVSLLAAACCAKKKK